MGSNQSNQIVATTTQIHIDDEIVYKYLSKIGKLLSPRPLVYRQNIRATETELKQWIYFATIKGKHSTLKLVIQRVKHEIICSHGLCTNWAHIKRFGPLIDSRDIQLSLI